MAGTEPPGWLDELDLHVGPPDTSMGTRALDLDDWFLVDDDWEPQRAEAAVLLASARDDVLVGTGDPAVRGPAEELLATIRTLLSRSGPPIRPHAVGSVGQNGVEHSLAEARRLVADDLCVLLPDGDRWVLAAGAVCFPSHWRPSDKVGQPLADVHVPVPGYPGALAGRVDGFLGRLAPGRGVRRRNWLVHHVPDLHVPTTPPVPEPVPAPGERWLRSERQALVRLREHDAVVFSIRTQQVPLRALTARPDVCAGLAAALRGWSPAQRAYKGDAVDDALLRWLDDHACADRPPAVDPRAGFRRR